MTPDEIAAFAPLRLARMGSLNEEAVRVAFLDNPAASADTSCKAADPRVPAAGRPVDAASLNK